MIRQRRLEALKAAEEYENTLIFFMSDNGGPCDHNGSSNWPLRGKKEASMREATVVH